MVLSDVLPGANYYFLWCCLPGQFVYNVQVRLAPFDANVWR